MSGMHGLPGMNRLIVMRGNHGMIGMIGIPLMNGMSEMA